MTYSDEYLTIKESLIEHLFTALSDAEVAVRSGALRLLVRLPNSDRTWYRLAEWVEKELDLYLLPEEAAKAQIPFEELLDAAVRIPVSTVRRRLYDFLGQERAEDTRRQVVWKLAQVRDHEVAEGFLFPILDSENEYERQQAAFWLAHYRLHFLLEDFVRLAGEHHDPIVRFWLSVAALRQEEPQPFIDLLSEYLEGKLELPLLWGNPFDLASRVAECIPEESDFLALLGYIQSEGQQPKPEQIQGLDKMHKLLSTKKDRLRDLLPLVESLIDLLTPPLAPTEQTMEQPAQPSVPWEGDVEELAKDLVQGREESRDSLAQLSAAQKASLISAWFTGLEKRTARDEQTGEMPLYPGIGNAIIELPGWFWQNFDPDLAQLFDIYLVLQPERTDLMSQLAWVVSRAGTNRLIEEYLPLLPVLETADKIALLQLLEQAVVFTDKDFGPIYGAGPATRETAPVTGHFIDELGAAVGADGGEGVGLVLGEEEEKPRYVQGVVYDNSDKGNPQKLERAFLAGKEHLLKVWIGELMAGAIHEPKPIDLGMLPDQASWDLQVYFWEPNHAPEVQIGTLTVYQEQLPDLPINNCEFRFTPRADLPNFQGRLAVVYQKNVLQMLFLEGKVVVEAASAAESDQIRFEWAVVKGLKNADQRQEFDLVFYNETDPLQGAGLLFFGGQAGLKRVNGLQDSIQGMINALREAGTPGAASLKAREEELVLLALQGSLLYKTILEQIGAENEALLHLRQAQRLQLVSAVRDIFPLELVYVYTPPNPDAVLCPNAEQAMQIGACFTCDGLNEEEAAKVICPLGFLGMRCTIERHAIQPVDKTGIALEGKDYQLRVGLSIGGKTIDPLKSSLCATSAKVTSSNRQKLVGSLKAIFSNSFQLAENWTDWKTKIKDQTPSILILVPHTDKFRKTIPTLEIGNSVLFDTGINESVVRASKEAKPLVMLIGCETAVPDAPYQGFAAAFSQAGAAITVMTLSPIHESHAVKITEILVNQFHQSAQLQQTFSEALLQARRTAMREGYAEVLTLVADGDADWILIEE